MTNTKQAGDEGERMACEYITEQGMRVLARNYFSGKEEIDIIARDGSVTVFIEVKERTSSKYGMPAEAGTPFKQRSIMRAAVNYLKKNKLLNSSIRFDVAAIYKGELKYIKNAFDATGMMR